ncbi:hypothetical protein GLOIN_2v1773106 [Rhizophagus irregularis DAOM 181602=DAOM 197198]|uniref:Uncharacterized protein n=1 Tax=Rhizophagus irregularis (strain DAOM 181602 / DAOM 197198 / MUCL 43194) TaxID=747089 RepID=A0A2P4Q5V9_RHIID|nr:hypothetical protein GLOIN_2v1773106 [Rhizophagus irregularis DAOM 181602=DAOM 197198]POG72992.1 hypothetical protein GLOIN_2v1773106 [Rhizophagus irregularis DAOM 181602=DAOM 197198]GET51890.1 hypothetical protein GLOIN_2v1773106 [Rhizophagus irregularis DAOM 181602=DAOM 197198]|eukprot:XP_025179858.1 hypothetical protein GLOIN_2v1773106 [Rhizophagus irregularis DAOM 181602=DAOM 197198]
MNFHPFLRKDGSSKIEIGHHITTSISEGDEYSWVYRDKNQKKRYNEWKLFANWLIDEERDTYEVDLTYLYGILDQAKELLEESRNEPKGFYG